MSRAGTVALDIETVVRGPPADTTLEDHELFCICLGHRPGPDEPVESAVFLRDRWGPAGELAVLEAALDWLEPRQGDRLLTYNGADFDLPRLRARAVECLERLDSTSPALTRLETVLATHEHEDLFLEVCEPYERTVGHRPSFEAACEAVGVTVPETPLADYDLGFIDLAAHRSTIDAMKSHLIGIDVPVLGERYLDLLEAGAAETNTVREIEAAVTHYARTDVEPLFALADARPFEDALAALETGD